MRLGGLFAVPLVALLGACSSGDLDVPWAVSSRVPFPFELPGPTPTSTPITVSFGDGRDGDRTFVAGSNAITNCWPVVSATGANVVSTAALPLVAGDRILLHQTQDVFATIPTASPMLEVGEAGRWEIAVVASTSGTAVSVDPPLTYGYDSSSGRRAQLCRLRQYQNVSVVAPALLTPSDWNGTTGGILAFFVNGTLTLTTAGAGANTGALSADGRGFRPGDSLENGSTVADITAETTTLQNGGAKGEGLDATYFGQYGRGNPANGGGGGNGRFGGGGGGGGFGSGGLGGRQAQGQGDVPATAGRGGAAAVAPERLFFGGGGGVGHTNNEQGVAGRGGGIVLVFARNITGAGHVRANGGDALDVNDKEGGPGGGGGGTVVMAWEGGIGWTGAVTVIGGDGGSTRGDAIEHCGPGGGGGGGRVLVVEGALPSARIDDSGGPTGTNLDGDPWGAEPGAAGGGAE